MSTRTPPIAPRSMLSRASGESIDWDALWEQTFATISKELYPRLALFEALARFKSRSERRTLSSDEVVETRRAFLDSFAYLCDVQKGGATVTVAGLQKLPESNILWLAANEGVRNDIKVYAENILLKLKNLNPNSEQDAQDEIFHLAVERCSPRIIVYQDEMKRLARNCRMQLKRETQNDTVMSLRRKLKKLSEPPPSMMLTDVVDFCYLMRGLDINEIKRRSKNALDDYDKLAHYIGRLGATRSSVLAVIKGMIRIPALQQISGIRTVEAPDMKEVTLDQWALTPYEVFRGICQDPVSQNPLQNAAALHALVELDLPSGTADVRVRLAQRRTITTRVHSELQIADKFSRRFMEFVGGDKYIGCSKPACYFCFNWLSNHKHKYVPPAAHLKIIPGCRGPDNRGVNESRVVILQDMYAKMCTRLGQDILDFLLHSVQGHSHARYQYQSTDGSSHA